MEHIITGETFVIKKIYKIFNVLRLVTFYVCDSFDYLDYYIIILVI